MTPANAHVVITQGAQQIAASAPWALLDACAWIVVTVGAIGLLYVIGHRLLRPWRLKRMPVLALPPASPCPSCTGRPMESDDCTCPEDCGVAWCQAADPEEIDVPDWVKRHDSVTDVLAEWEREWNRKKGNDA